MAAQNRPSGWRELPMAAVLPAGTAFEYKTGTWRTYKPVWLAQKCIHCLQCWFICPDFSVLAKDGKLAGFDYDHCKGCGLCAYICPVKGKAIVMEKEVRE
ncbi:MAG: 4Fe-4S binding protein [Candidatus Omnitrophica bacterium]|nr:4Fe-4S binding protein [Candidatus Omnitrophota bacterium]